MYSLEAKNSGVTCAAVYDVVLIARVDMPCIAMIEFTLNSIVKPCSYHTEPLDVLITQRSTSRKADNTSNLALCVHNVMLLCI